MNIGEHKPYFYEDIEIPSVTTILKLLNKPELFEWANFMGRIGIDSTAYTAESAEIGTYAHYIIERKCKKKIIDYSDLYEMTMGKRKKILNAVKSFEKWRKDKKPTFLHNELVVKDECVGGTIDCICKIDDEKYMVDFKTSKRAYASYFLQLAGYNYLYKKTKNKTLDKVAILVLDKKKINYEFVIMEIWYLEKYYEPIFLLLIHVYYKWSQVLRTDWNEKI